MTDPGGRDPVNRSRTGAAGWVFPFLLLAFAAFFLGGRIGWWSDDYWHCQLDPVTGASEGLTIRRGFFLRPLFYTIVPAVTTLSWKSQWPAHLLLVSVHGAVVGALWRLKLALGLSRRAAGAAALLFMVYPGHFEAIFWVAALPTPIATLLMLGVMGMMVRLAREADSFASGREQRARVSNLVRAIAGAAGWVALVCCLNEQPAAGVAAIPAVYWAARRKQDQNRRDRTWAWIESLVLALACSIVVAAYAAAVLLDPHKPPSSRGSVDRMVPLFEIGPRLVGFLDVLWRRLLLKDFAEGALITGWNQIRATGPFGLAWLGALVIAGALWVRTWAEKSGTATGSLGRIAAVGGIILATGWLPIVVFAGYSPDPRTCYWPAAGAAVLLAVALDAIGSRVARGRPSPRSAILAAGGVLLAILLVCGTMLVGIQSAFRIRYRLDQSEGEELRRLLPNPAPLSFFIPLRIDEHPIHTPSPVFDRHLGPVWQYPWATPKFIQSVYRRRDVRCGFGPLAPDYPVRGADESGIYYADRLGPAFPAIDDSAARLPWDRAVPFVVDRDGGVHLVTSIATPAARPDQPFVEIRIPQVPAGTPELRVTLPRA